MNNYEETRQKLKDVINSMTPDELALELMGFGLVLKSPPKYKILVKEVREYDSFEQAKRAAEDLKKQGKEVEPVNFKFESEQIRYDVEDSNGTIHTFYDYEEAAVFVYKEVGVPLNFKLKI